MATDETATFLIDRLPKGAQPKPHLSSTPLTALHEALSYNVTKVDLVCVSGDAGSGKTTSVLTALHRHRFVTFYTLADELNMKSLEDRLTKISDRAEHATVASDYFMDAVRRSSGCHQEGRPQKEGGASD